MAKKIILTPVSTALRRTHEILAEIREIYFKTSRSTILRDFDRAIDLLKTIPEPGDRQRATVFMDGLAEMRKEFTSAGRTFARPAGQARARSGRRPASSDRGR